MKIIWKIKNSINIVDAAINHHISDLSETYKHKLFSFAPVDIDDVIFTYKIEYFENRTYINGDDLAFIKLRKTSDNLTEVTIFDPY